MCSFIARYLVLAIVLHYQLVALHGENRNISTLVSALCGPTYNARSCQCTQHCIDLGNCCFDCYMLDNVSTVELNNISSCHEPTWINKKYWNERLLDTFYDILTNKIAYGMITKCPREFSSPLIRQRCENEPKSIADHLPVSSSDDAVTYKNKFCALCNSQTDVVPWTIALYWPSEPENSQLRKTIQLLSDRLDDNLDVFLNIPLLKFFPRNDSSVANIVCFDWEVRDCSIITEPFVEKACKSYVRHVSIPNFGQLQLFRNPHCALCNGKNLDKTARCNDIIQWNPYRPGEYMPSFTAIINFRSVFRGGTTQCPRGQFYNPYQDICQPFVCPTGLYADGDKCQDPLVSLAGTLRKITYTFRTIAQSTSNFDSNFIRVNIFTRYGIPRRTVLVKYNKTMDIEVKQSDFKSTYWFPWTDRFEKHFFAMFKGKATIYCSATVIENGVFLKMETHMSVKGDARALYQFLDILSKSLSNHTYFVNVTGMKNTDPVTCPMVRLSNSTKMTSSMSNGTLESTGFICVDEFLKLTELKLKDMKKISSSYQGIVSLSLTVVSGSSLLVTITTYFLLEDMRGSYIGKITINLMASLLLAQLSFQFGVHALPFKILCKVVAVVTHFAWLSYFAWILIFNCQLFRSFSTTSVLVSQFNQRAQETQYREPMSLFLFFRFSMGFLFPAPIVGVALVFEFIDNTPLSIGYGNEICWISNHAAILYFFAIPIATCVVIASLLATASVVCFYRLQVGLKSRRKNEYWLLLISCRLIAISGITWVFGYLNSWYPHDVFAYLFIVFNNTQGFNLFLAFVAKKRILNQCRSVVWSSNACTSSGVERRGKAEQPRGQSESRGPPAQ